MSEIDIVDVNMSHIHLFFFQVFSYGRLIRLVSLLQAVIGDIRR